MKVTLPKDINKTQRKVSLRSWITLLIGAAALLGLFFLLRLHRITFYAFISFHIYLPHILIDVFFLLHLYYSSFTSKKGYL